MKRLTAYFSGTVQGVGFRYTVERISRHFPVTGYVKNLRDGRVEVVAESEERDLKDFLAAIRESSMKSYICDLEVAWSEAQGEFKAFGVGF